MTTPSSSQPTYDLPFFRRLFENTIEEHWCITFRTTVDEGIVRHCALGWCDGLDGVVNGGGYGAASHALADVFGPLTHGSNVMSLGNINDGKDHRYQQPTPRARILAAITDLERMATALQS